MPSGRPSQQDQRAYRLTVTVRALRVLKLLNVDVGPLIAIQEKLLGEFSCSVVLNASTSRQNTHKKHLCTYPHLLCLMQNKCQ